MVVRYLLCKCVAQNVRNRHVELLPAAKLQESNVFTHVCLFTAWGPYVTITNDALYLTVQAPPQPKSVVVL